MKSALSVAVLGTAALLLVGQASAVLPAPLAATARASGISPDGVSFYVREVGAGAPLFEHRALLPMNPASTMKLMTTLVGLDVLSPSYSWKTQFLTAAPVVDGVLKGSLIIKGAGDPKFTWEHLQTAIKALREMGIKDIAGDVLLDRSRFAGADYDPAQFDGEPLKPYNVGPDALLFDFKSVGFKFALMPDGSVSISTDGPQPDGLSIVNRLRPSQGACGDWRTSLGASFESFGNRASATFNGSYPTECGDKEWYVSLFSHTGLLAGAFAKQWRDAGGAWTGTMHEGLTPVGARELYANRSQSLASMVTDINKFSNNVMARQLLLSVDAEISKRPALASRGAQSVRSWAKAHGLDLPELVIENGSGLSRKERISAKSMASLLEFGLTAPFASDFVSSLPLAATDGTISKRFIGQSAEGRAYLKTGTLTGVKALAGYLLLPGERKLLFVGIINHPNAEKGQKLLDDAVEWSFQAFAKK